MVSYNQGSHATQRRQTYAVRLHNEGVCTWKQLRTEGANMQGCAACVSYSSFHMHVKRIQMLGDD